MRQEGRGWYFRRWVPRAGRQYLRRADGGIFQKLGGKSREGGWGSQNKSFHKELLPQKRSGKGMLRERPPPAVVRCGVWSQTVRVADLGLPIASVLGFAGSSDGTEFARNAGDPGLVPVSGRSPGAGNGHPLQCSCLENPMDRGAWWAIVHGVAKSQTELSTEHFHITSWWVGPGTQVGRLGEPLPLPETPLHHLQNWATD